ncbi:MAG: type II toxin-antitoxin system VapC family toxin [Desulfobacula sp.]|uniref:type II toxin-antitoxin system VapC family toxin n=1 Tax=Desulfobacula sp. TaxID=2593537 RepID=UPI001D935B6D|nr:type II toxin-antitoxin system VapC family toxin [Desulfobacula sp.]MBT3486423.1 type II toxin-antitoxin system VapC family toxin [Desulfobacula sp.]MBT3805044.1 type II toxin-antitoxin system VapC family toxin [Desulfobacula sp.]MBT4025546.1 type II toxin-antitoxin system VapC family toxin [Desulfobacula sp.]MBT4199726.1 type II toxin-antitoxin system VapC family toxin [Desulfobacula sp.]
MTSYLLDTHALIFWFSKENVSQEYIDFLDEQNELENLYVSSISFWETALLVKKKRIELKDVNAWRISLIENSNIKLIRPSAREMIESTNLPDYHKDPFDRLLIVQALTNNCLFVTKDKIIQQYNLKTFWI